MTQFHLHASWAGRHHWSRHQQRFPAHVAKKGKQNEETKTDRSKCNSLEGEAVVDIRPPCSSQIHLTRIYTEDTLFCSMTPKMPRIHHMKCQLFFVVDNNSEKLLVKATRGHCHEGGGAQKIFSANAMMAQAWCPLKKKGVKKSYRNKLTKRSRMSTTLNINYSAYGDHPHHASWECTASCERQGFWGSQLLLQWTQEDVWRGWWTKDGPDLPAGSWVWSTLMAYLKCPRINY